MFVLQETKVLQLKEFAKFGSPMKIVKEFGGKSQFKYQVRNDKRKYEYAKKNNITLIEIPYTCNTYEKELEFLQNNKVI